MQSIHLFPARSIGLIRVWLICLCLGALITHAADRYVTPPGGYGTNNPPYINWADATTNIQWAVNVATNGDTVWVTNGNYRLTNEIFFGTNTPNSTNITLKSVNGRDATFLNGDYAAGNVITNRCIVISNNDVTIDGFTISNGYATPWGKNPNEGGGILALSGAKILNCTIRNNYAAWIGGGVEMTGSGIISNCIIKENEDGWREGAVVVRNSLTTIANCIISRNQVGVGQISGRITIRNCVISHNYSPGSSSHSGAGVRCGNNTIVENCAIVSNYWTGTPGRGGGIGIREGGTNIVIRNCIIYSNYAATAGMDWYTNNSTGTVFYSCCTSTTNGMEGSGNITNWPMFVDYSATNYRLLANSPCINGGTNQSWMTNACDLDGRTRIRYGTVDMGAYERINEGTIYRVQ